MSKCRQQWCVHRTLYGVETAFVSWCEKCEYDERIDIDGATEIDIRLPCGRRVKTRLAG